MTSRRSGSTTRQAARFACSTSAPTVLFASALALVSSGPQRAAAAAGCSDGVQTSGAIYRICMPANWNGGLILYAHGFVDPTKPVGIPEDQMMLPDGTTFASIANGLG